MRFSIKKPSSRMMTQNYDCESESTLESEYASMNMQSMDRVPRGIETEENRVYFYCPIGGSEALELNRILRRLDVEMQYLKTRLECREIPIHLHIHSPGGSIFAGLAIVDTIKNCKTPIYTYIDGSAASAATLVSIAGKRRFIGDNGYMLIHQPQIEWAGKFDEFMDEIENQKSLYEKVVHLYLTHTKINEEDIKEMLDHELWLDSNKCVELGLVDKVS